MKAGAIINRQMNRALARFFALMLEKATLKLY